MADPSTYRPKAGEIPTDPGVYRFRDTHQRVIYVGKAKNLRARLSNYFQDVANLHPRTYSMVTTAASVEWTTVGTELEALTLEYTWIKEFDPRFNVKYRDDKSYPFLAVTLSEEFPRALVMRGDKRSGTRYFGPYGHAWAIRDTLDLLLRVFPIRTCSPGVFKRAARSERPCLLGYIDKCSAPCVGRVTPEQHRALVTDFCDFMAGDTGRFVKDRTAQMAQAAAEMDYERAARLRDDIAALEKSLDKNAVVLPDATDADVFGIAGDELEAAVQVFHVRGGRIRGQRGWIVEKTEELSDAELVERLLMQVYGDSTEVPREVLVPQEPSDLDQVTEVLRGNREGRAVSIRIPQRGKKRELAETVTKNAEQALALHRTRRAGDLTTRSQALQEIQEALGLEEAPLRIECFDISHTQGTYQSASMVVFEDGLPRKSEYRLFNVRGADGNGARDDTEAMYEVLCRRFKRIETGRLSQAAEQPSVETNRRDPATPPADAASAQNDGGVSSPADAGSAQETGRLSQGAEQPSVETNQHDPTTPEKKRFAYPPNLIVVDGGEPQVAAAQRAVTDMGVTTVAIAGLAKRLEELWVPEDPYPVILERASEGLYLLQRVRDEAHRFAIRAHRTRRSKGMTVSALDSIPGLGPIRAKELLKHFGSLKKLKAASPQEIATVRGIGPVLAETIHQALAAG
jgi:excinuclease ABC subunit C